MSIASEFQVTIAAGGTVSDVKDIGNNLLVGIVTPAALTGTSFALNVAPNNPNALTPLYNKSGVAFALTVAANRWTSIPPNDTSVTLAGVRHVQVVSNATEAADRVITLVCATRPAL